MVAASRSTSRSRNRTHRPSRARPSRGRPPRCVLRSRPAAPPPRIQSHSGPVGLVRPRSMEPSEETDACSRGRSRAVAVSRRGQQIPREPGGPESHRSTPELELGADLPWRCRGWSAPRRRPRRCRAESMYTPPRSTETVRGVPAGPGTDIEPQRRPSPRSSATREASSVRSQLPGITAFPTSSAPPFHAVPAGGTISTLP